MEAFITGQRVQVDQRPDPIFGLDRPAETRAKTHRDADVAILNILDLAYMDQPKQLFDL